MTPEVTRYVEVVADDPAVNCATMSRYNAAEAVVVDVAGLVRSDSAHWNMANGSADSSHLSRVLADYFGLAADDDDCVSADRMNPGGLREQSFVRADAVHHNNLVRADGMVNHSLERLLCRRRLAVLKLGVRCAMPLDRSCSLGKQVAHCLAQMVVSV